MSQEKLILLQKSLKAGAHEQAKILAEILLKREEFVERTKQIIEEHPDVFTQKAG